MRRVVPLGGESAEELPLPCRACVHWELGGPSPDPRGDGSDRGGTRAPTRPSDPARPPDGVRPVVPERPSDPDVRKQAWISSRVQEGTPPGRVVHVDGEVVAYALFAPAETFARRGGLAPQVDREALTLATMWVAPVHRGGGLGRLLLHAALKEAIRLDRPTVQAYGDRRWHERACMLPATWLLHEGFEVHREHPRTPLLQLETRRTIRWAGSLEQALEEVLARLPQRAQVPRLVPRSVPDPVP